jgi:hypothetical protein
MRVDDLLDRVLLSLVALEAKRKLDVPNGTGGKVEVIRWDVNEAARTAA